MLAEVVSRYLITTGGIGTIVAVVGVFLFLLYVVSPLFFAGSAEQQPRTTVNWANPAPIQMGMDEDQLMCWALFGDGSLQLVRADTGEFLEKQKPFGESRLTAVAFSPGQDAAFGFADGTLRTGSIHFSSRYLDDKEKVPAEVTHLKEGEAARYQNGMVLRIPRDQLRLQKLAVDINPPLTGGKKIPPSPVLLIDFDGKPEKHKAEETLTVPDEFIATLTAHGKLSLHIMRPSKTLDGDETILALSKRVELPYEQPTDKGPPMRLQMSSQGHQICLFWEDGHFIRYDVRDRARPVVAETLNLLSERARRVTEVRCLKGRSTYLVGDSAGQVKAWFFTPNSAGGKMVCGHEFAGEGSAVTAIAVSNRSREAAVASADGKIRLLQVTSERLIVELSTEQSGPVKLALAPKDDGLLVAAANGLHRWKIDAGHPEVTVKALFGKVWYEGNDRPEFTWLTDSAEPKFSLVPLIFGTIKASFYSLLFALPIALLAAIYTSEYLHPQSKAVVKPSIELMASLPSVVLGFLAGLVFAQFVEGVVSSVLACIVTVPLSFVMGAYFWQLLPARLGQVLARWRFMFICLVLPLGLLMAMPLGPWMEDVLFEGDLRHWLDSGEGSAVGGWILVLLPVAVLVCAIGMSKTITPWFRSNTRQCGRFLTAVLDMSKFLAGCVLALGLAWALGFVLDALDLDARGSFLGPYSQRNALIVGLMVGFAIIPIIYTIAEDALSSVPEYLRAGSLATGATRWQTAVRIVIPTAMSGLFSAVMIGLGRAIGETMVMLMAAGNTPIMDWNIFNGFRTLSANIATEMGDAVQNSTHYRVLFCSALTLFALTFSLNTVAELVRLRFRRRAYQL